MSPDRLAEKRIRELGITRPQEIDVDLIAMDAGMRVEYRDLAGCEAMLVGVGDTAIATVKPSPSRGRERYSVGHELGHWEMHRGTSFKCRVDDPDRNFASDRSLEKEADTYSAGLLMPSFLFEPAIKACGDPSFIEIEELARDFGTSVLATSMRIADLDVLPVIVACYSRQGLRWRKPAAHISRKWFLRQELDDDSFAYNFFENGEPHPRWGKQGAETWFENTDADKYQVRECCRPIRKDELLVLLFLENKMLNARFDGTRKYSAGATHFARN